LGLFCFFACKGRLDGYFFIVKVVVLGGQLLEFSVGFILPEGDSLLSPLLSLLLEFLRKLSFSSLHTVFKLLIKCCFYLGLDPGPHPISNFFDHIVITQDFFNSLLDKLLLLLFVHSFVLLFLGDFVIVDHLHHGGKRILDGVIAFLYFLFNLGLVSLGKLLPFFLLQSLQVHFVTVADGGLKLSP
jgi:hypothetical protein